MNGLNILIKFFFLTVLFAALFLQAAGQQSTTGTVVLFSSRPAGEAFRLRSGDELSLRVLGRPEFSAEFQVDGNGTVSLPFTDDLRAAGLTIKEIREEIKLRVQKYLRNPQVSVRFLRANQNPVKVYAQYDAQGREARVFTSPMRFESFKAWTFNLEVSSARSDEIEFAFSPPFRDNTGKYELSVRLDEGENLFLGNAAIEKTDDARLFGGEDLSKNKVKVPLKTLARIAAAKKVEIKLGHRQFQLKQDELEAMRFMADHISSISRS